MKDKLKQQLLLTGGFDADEARWQYKEDLNPDALSDLWLERNTSYIYKVGVLTAIDSNKCDWVYVAIGTQRSENSEVNIIGQLCFEEGENDDIARVIQRALKMLTFIHPVFDRD